MDTQLQEALTKVEQQKSQYQSRHYDAVKRAKEMLLLKAAGQSLAEIGKQYSISRARVKQIIDWYITQIKK